MKKICEVLTQRKSAFCLILTSVSPVVEWNFLENFSKIIQISLSEWSDLYPGQVQLIRIRPGQKVRDSRQRFFFSYLKRPDNDFLNFLGVHLRVQHILPATGNLLLSIQGGSDISGLLSKLHCGIRINFLLIFFAPNHLSCLPKHK